MQPQSVLLLRQRLNYGKRLLARGRTLLPFFFTGAFLMFFDPKDAYPTLSKLWTPIGIVFGGLFGYLLTAIDFSQGELDVTQCNIGDLTNITL
mmetsp:Transcript_1156/g.1350  ORF Transcript_1156/g.1350 Transcript_1156/m.1350 type:complete len:93 (+) Transcript_1156:300-578(+)